MHRTLSIDYGVVLEGEMKLVLDSGESRVLKRGDVAIQRGTMHQWVNVDKQKWARMMFVLQESKPVIVASSGVELKEELGGLGDELRPST
jgi:quercetin dioxygenase-like cupin family protein